MTTSTSNQSQTIFEGVTLLTGRVTSGLCILVLLFDASMKVARSSAAVNGKAELGFSDTTVAPFGPLILAFTVLYCIPRTAVFGAVLLTAHLGGAVAIFIQQFTNSLTSCSPCFFVCCFRRVCTCTIQPSKDNSHYQEGRLRVNYY